MLVTLDIDGTLADISRRLQIAGIKPQERDRTKMQEWLDRLQKPEDLISDARIEEVCRLVQLLTNSLDPNVKLVYVTGRSDVHFDVTKRWLKENGLPNAPLYMRDKNDWSSASKYKERVMLQLKERYGEPILVIDDDPDDSCTEMYQRIGARHLKVMG